MTPAASWPLELCGCSAYLIRLNIHSLLEGGIVILRRRVRKVRATACGRLGLRAGPFCQSSPSSSRQTTLSPNGHRLDLCNCLAKGIFIPCTDGETEAQSEQTHSRFPTPLGSRGALPWGWLCSSWTRTAVGGQRAHGGRSEHAGAGLRPRALCWLKGESGSRLRGSCGGPGGSSALCCPHSLLPLALQTRTSSGASPARYGNTLGGIWVSPRALPLLWVSIP